MKVIINADDLGISLEVNKAIESAIIEGKISSSSILANGPAYEDAIRIAKLYPHISFGVHLNLVEFHAMTNNAILYKNGIVDDKGVFRDGAVFILDHFSEELKKAIFEEWSTQISKLINSGISISHLDSHQHTHGIFELRRTLLSLLEKFHINKVRRRAYSPIKLMLMTRNHSNEIPLDKSKTVKKKRQNFVKRRFHHLIMIIKHYYWIHSMKKYVIMTTDFHAYSTFTYCYTNYFSRKSISTIELMCHPGHKNYAREANAVLSNKLANLTDFKMISYNNL